MDKEKIAIGIIERLHQNGYDAYFAGGCVRDRLRGVEPKDFDIATSATPDKIQKLFKKTLPVGVQFGVVLVMEEDLVFEVATFRTDGGYQDGRHPTSVSFTNVEEDAKRRDFTVNGLYFDVKNKKILDFVGGEADLKKKVIRTIGSAEKRFQEDALRMMRAIRFAVQLEFEIEPATFESVKKNHALIEKVSQERIREELSKTLISSNPSRGVKLLDESQLLQKIIPEIEVMKGVEQPMQYHPEGDVYVHTLMLMDGLSHPPVELALGCLLHDIAKPATFTRGKDRIRFHGHDKLGAEMTRTILKRLTYPNQQVDLVAELVAEHLKFKDVFQMKVSTLRRFFSLNRFDLHLELHRLDCLASHGDLTAYQFCQEKLKEYGALPPPPSKLVTGDDLIGFGLKPGPQFSKIIRAVEDAALEGSLKTREAALDFVKDLLAAEKKP